MTWWRKRSTRPAREPAAARATGGAARAPTHAVPVGDTLETREIRIRAYGGPERLEPAAGTTDLTATASHRR